MANPTTDARHRSRKSSLAYLIQVAASHLARLAPSESLPSTSHFFRSPLIPQAVFFPTPPKVQLT